MTKNSKLNFDPCHGSGSSLHSDRFFFHLFLIASSLLIFFQDASAAELDFPKIEVQRPAEQPTEALNNAPRSAVDSDEQPSFQFKSSSLYYRQDPFVAHTTSFGAQNETGSAPFWARLRAGFKMQQDTDPLTLKYKKLYTSNPETLLKALANGKLYLTHILGEIEQRGLPAELALLPIVESAYNPKALSGSQAAGLWQFIPGTAKTFDLHQTWWQDQRRDVAASTDAALDYLGQLKQEQGNWSLALASYNAGTGTVNKAKKNVKRFNGLAGLHLPRETIHYVPKLMALRSIFSDKALLSRLGIDEMELGSPLFLTRLPVDTDLSKAAEMAEISVETFKELNPSFNKLVLPKNSMIALPEESAPIFARNMAAAPLRLSSWRSYFTKPGDTLYTLAARFGADVSELEEANNIKIGTPLHPGQPFLVPSQNHYDPAPSADIGASYVAPPSGTKRPPHPPVGMNRKNGPTPLKSVPIPLKKKH